MGFFGFGMASQIKDLDFTLPNRLAVENYANRHSFTPNGSAVEFIITKCLYTVWGY